MRERESESERERERERERVCGWVGVNYERIVANDGVLWRMMRAE